MKSPSDMGSKSSKDSLTAPCPELQILESERDRQTNGQSKGSDDIA